MLAKVTRDRIMREMDALYPEYGFAKHKGYGTKLHYQILDEYDASEVHRKSFLKKYYAAREKAIAATITLERITAHILCHTLFNIWPRSIT